MTTLEEQKELFRRKDRMLRGITKDGFFKIAVVKTTEVVRTAKARHDLSLLSTVMLGRALTGVMLLASDLKGEERIQARFEGKGPVGALVAEANHAGEIRGYVRHPHAELPLDAASFSDGLGLGLLHITKILFDEAQPITGTVQLAHSNITGDLAHYLAYSEQIPSALLIDVGIDAEGKVEEAGGILVQALPDAPTEKIELIENNFASLGSLSALLREDGVVDALLERALEPMPAKELARYPVHFFCRCNRQRFKDLLVTLGAAELRSLKTESQELVCNYCNEKYLIEPHEIQEILAELN